MHIKWRDMLTLPNDRNIVLCTRKIQTQHKANWSGVEKGGGEKIRGSHRWEKSKGVLFIISEDSDQDWIRSPCMTCAAIFFFFRGQAPWGWAYRFYMCVTVTRDTRRGKIWRTHGSCKHVMSALSGVHGSSFILTSNLSIPTCWNRRHVYWRLIRTPFSISQTLFRVAVDNELAS